MVFDPTKEFYCYSTEIYRQNKEVSFFQLEYLLHRDAIKVGK